jgi:hypothetical protein
MWWNKSIIRITLLLLFCMATRSVTAQTQDSLPPFDKGSHHLFIAASFDLNASTLTNQFLSKLYRGGNLDYNLRQENSQRLDKNNIAGYNLSGGMYYFFAPTSYKDKFGYYIGIEEHSIGEISFRKNFYDLVFFGNQQFSDQFAKFDNMYFSLMDFQQIKAGIFKVIKSKKGQHQIGWDFGFNLGQRNISADIREGCLFTQKDGEYVALTTDMTIHRTDTNNSKFGASNGYGLVMDFSYNYTDRINHEFQFKVNNVGYIRWDRSPDNFDRDTTFKYEGINVDLFDISGKIINPDFGDSVANEILASDRISPYLTWIPLDISMIYTYHFSDTPFQLTVEGRERLFSVYKPYLSFSPGYTLKMKKSGLGIFPVLSYGGYGGWNAGLNLNLQIKNKTYISLGTNALNSLISPSSSAGVNGVFTFYQTL